MKHFDLELKKYADKVKLKVAERRELRERILAYMEYHPLPKAKGKTSAVAARTESYIFLPLNTLYTRVAAGVFALVLIVGVPVAAERAVPGDVLYPVKTNVNESIRAQFANSPYEKVAFETELLQRRIAEARRLSEEGKLTKEVEVKIAATVRQHANAAQESIEALKESDAEEGAIAEISFESTLDVHSAVLESGDGAHTTTPTNNEIANAVREAIATSDARKGMSTLSFGRLSAQIEQETTRAHELFETVNGSVIPVERSDIERRLDDVNRKAAKAQELREAGEEDAAVAELTKALSKTNKLIAFMTYIDVRENVPLDTLVPVELTDEERSTLLTEALGGVRNRLADVTERAELLENEAAAEKVALGAATVTELVATATSTLEAGELDAADAAIAEAHELLLDLEGLVPEHDLKEDDEEEVPGAEPKGNTGTSTGTSTEDWAEGGDEAAENADRGTSSGATTSASV